MSRILKRISTLLVALLVMVMVVPSAMVDMNGINVSGWQPAGITRQVQADFAVAKVTQNTGFVNTAWRVQAQGALDTGKKLGLYHYAGGNNATAEANHFTNHTRSYVGRAVLVLDWESYQNGAWGNGNWVREFVRRVHAMTGVWPMVCANTLPTAGCPDTLARWISTCSVAKPGSGTSTSTPTAPPSGLLPRRVPPFRAWITKCWRRPRSAATTATAKPAKLR